MNKVWTVTITIEDANGTEDPSIENSAQDISDHVRRNIDIDCGHLRVVDISTCLGKPMKERNSQLRRPRAKYTPRPLGSTLSLSPRGEMDGYFLARATESGSRCGHEDAPCCGC